MRWTSFILVWQYSKCAVVICRSEYDTIHQPVFVIESYFKTGSIKQTQQDFNAKFPGVNVPIKNAIQKLVKKFRDTGSVLNKKQTNYSRRVRNPEIAHLISQRMVASPRKSTRRLSQQCGVSRA